jgi:RNA polymerase sigma factor (sigma-70 family)
MVDATCDSAQNVGSTYTTRASLLVRVRNFQDKQSWDEFVELYGPLILRYLRKTGVLEQDAVDLVQDVFGILVRHIVDFRYDSTRSFRAWLRTIANHRAFRFFSQRGRWPRTPANEAQMVAFDGATAVDAEQDELIEAEWRKRRLEMAIKRLQPELSETAWQVFQRLIVEGESAGELAREFGMKVGALYTMKSRILRRLQEIAEEIDG